MVDHAGDHGGPVAEAVTEPMRPIRPVQPIRPIEPPVPVAERGGWRSHVPFLLVLLVAAVGMVRLGQYHWREGSVLIGGALALAGAVRAVLPTRLVGLLAVRGRVVDVLSYLALAGLMLFVALTLTGGPFG